MIWRRLLISSETSIAQLQECIQTVFDWTGEHLHRFRIHGKDYGIAYLGGISFNDNPHHVLLSHFRLHPRESFDYEYDFTANWRVDLRLEAILPQDGRPFLPICSGGRGAAPGEAYAGALAYLKELDRHRYAFPFEDLEKISDALQRWLDSGRDRQALGDIEELREAAERVAAYREFQLRRLDRPQVNRKLRTLSQEAVA